MKQELSTANHKVSSPVSSAGRARVSRMKDSPRAVTANGASPGSRPRPSSTNVARKSIQFNKLRPVVNDVRIPKERSHEDAKVAGLHGSQVVEQHARLQRRLESNFKGPEDGASTRIKELQGRLDESERTVRDLQSEVLALKTQIEKLQVLNVELESQKKKLEKDLSGAESKIKALEKHDQVCVWSYLHTLEFGTVVARRKHTKSYNSLISLAWLGLQLFYLNLFTLVEEAITERYFLMLGLTC